MKSAFILTASLTLGSLAVQADSPDPYRPTGRLNVSQHMVRQGVQPLLDWEITYPLKVTEIVDIDPTDDSITPKMRTLMEVRAVGAGFQIGSTHTKLALQAKVGGSAWSTLFLGRDNQVQPSNVLYSQIVNPGTRIDFAARAQQLSGSWYSSRNTLAPSPTVRALTAGSYVPNYLPAYNQGTVASFLTQYISSDNQVTIGPRDVIYLYELYSTDPSSSYFDMQDMVVVVSFKDVPVTP
jgi:hypothetical protein